MKPVFRCWNCKQSLPLDCFTASALRYKGECKICRKKSNARYWPKYSAALKDFEVEYEQMRDTPPAKESVSVDGTCAGYGLPGANGMLSVVRVLVDVLQDEGEKAGIKRGDRVRVVKIEEVQQ